MPRQPDDSGLPRAPLALVTCAGRSGSKWVMRLLDLSPVTLCRNEPHRIEPALADPDCPDWIDRAMHAGLKIGVHDLKPESVKAITRPWTAALRLDRALRSGTGRRLWGRAGVIRYPAALYRTANLGDMTRVLKIINARHLVCRVLAEHPEIPVIHVIRHPGGMLKSWITRFAPRFGDHEILETQRAIVRKIHGFDPAFQSVSGPADRMTLEEAKLWSWMHAQEHLLREGTASGRYRAVVFERLAAEPMPQVRSIYHAVGLELTPEIERGTANLTQRSASIAAAWRHELTTPQIEAVERMLAASPTLASLWTD
ncbi:MAG: sulfotransferase [Planctomycetota bacterium]